MNYCIDTSSLIGAWERHYPEECFPTLWSRLDDLAKANRLFAPEEVREELKKKSDGAWKWAKNQDGLFVSVDENQQRALMEILSAHQRLVESRKGRSGGDPWVIALAMVRGMTVVTEEKPNGLEKPRIPDVCMALGVECVSFLDIIKREKWRF